MNEDKMEKIVSLAKRRGFIYQGSEIYGGLAGTWDYGPRGVELKNNMKDLWWKMFVQDREDMYGIDSAILMNPKVWEASGHTKKFTDPMVEDIKTNKRYRADHLLEEEGIEAEGMSVEEINKIIEAKGLKSPDGNELGKARQFNIMFETSIGSVEGEDTKLYLRGETAQGMFVNFKNILDTLHPSLPFGLAQMGKAFRNEIAPRDFIFRSREFEILEYEYFIKEDMWEEAFEREKEMIWKWTDAIGLKRENIEERELSEEDRAHYSKRTIDLYYKYPFGSKELNAIAYRTDYDLSNHIKASSQKLEYFNQETGERFVPHVIEPTFGLERNILAVLVEAYAEETVEGEERVVLKLDKKIAPVKVAVLPLMRKDGLPEKARGVLKEIRANFVAEYDETASIGKRYRRQDEIGTPYCVTVDYESLEDESVTVRERDSMAQERVKIAELNDYLSEKLNG